MAKGNASSGGRKGSGGAGGRSAKSTVGGGASPATVTTASPVAAITSAIYQAGKSVAPSSGRIEIPALRAALPKLSPQAFDSHILRLQTEGKVVLMHDDSVRMRATGAVAAHKQKLRDEAVKVGGAERHIVYFERGWQGD